MPACEPVDERSASFNANWCREITAKAAAHWTEARLTQFADGKSLTLHPIAAAPLLRALGLLHRDGSLPPKEVRKYWQVSHMVNLLASPLRNLSAAGAPLRVVDVGCGRSYLTVVLAWMAKHVWRQPMQLLGIDRNADVVEECKRRVQTLELGAYVQFAHSTVQRFAPQTLWHTHFGASDARAELDVVIALHACDTATCDAIALGIKHQAALLAVAPCCQAQLARQWAAFADADERGSNPTPATCETTPVAAPEADAATPVAAPAADAATPLAAPAADANTALRGPAAPAPFAAIWRSPHLRRETAADITDALRTLALRACGYRANAIEFVPSQHTRKNTLIKAVRESDTAVSWRQPDPGALADYRALVVATGGADIALGALLDFQQ